jgi:hypothetical protein
VETKLARSPVIAGLLKDHKTPEEILGELFVRTLSRGPSEAEKKKLLPLVSAAPGDRKAYEDIFWALLNSTEFAFNH